MLAVPFMAVVLALTGLIGCSSSAGTDSSTSSAGERAHLHVILWPNGKQRAARPVRWTLRCAPVGGTLPRGKRACDRLAALRRPFRGVPRATACTQIYGGPQVAEVKGWFRDRRVASTFTRTDGCQIKRWDRIRFLFPT